MIRVSVVVLLSFFCVLASQQVPTDPPFPTVITRVGSEDRYAAIQKAIDDTIPLNGGSVYLDGSGHTKPFWVDRPVIVRGGNVEIKGRNGTSTRIQARGYFCPLLVGLRYNADPVKGTQANCWQESTDLDATAGKRFALRTRKQSVVEFLNSPLDAHPWQNTTEFTIDLALMVNEYGSDGFVSVCGAVNYLTQYSPVAVLCQQGSGGTRIYLQTTTGTHVPRVNWSPVVGQFYRLTIRCKLGVANGCKVWVDGTARPMHENPTVTGSFVKKVCNHGWGLGKTAFDSYFWGRSGPHDTEFHGFRLVAGPGPYTDADTQARADGQPITDLNRYFSKPPGTLLFLPLLENAPADRLVKWETADVPGHGFPVGYGYFLRHQNAAVGKDAVAGTRLRDLWVSSGVYGAAATLSGCYNFSAERCTFSGGNVCVGSFPHFVAYPVTFRDCELVGSSRAAGLHAYRWTATLDNVQITGYKGSAITSLGCNLDVRGSLIADVPTCDVAVRLLAGQAGGMYRFGSGTMFNFEGAGPSESYIDCHMETIPQSPQTNLVLDGVAFANNGPTTPAGRAYIRLYTGNNPGGNQGSLTSIGGSRFKNYPLAQVIGSDWTVTTLGAQPKNTPIKIDSAGNVINP